MLKFDPKNQSEFVSTGPYSVIFWNWKELELDGYVAKISKSDFGTIPGIYSSTIFLAGTMSAITGTSEGHVILWENQYSTILNEEPAASKSMRTASKVLRLVECGIRTMGITSNGYLVVACQDGAVRFYDFFFRLEAWFEDLSAGPVNSVSFSTQDCPFDKGEAGAPGLKFWVPDFVVSAIYVFFSVTSIFNSKALRFTFSKLRH
jgi:hypothetical protein